jgi:DNA topoisomerase-2
MSKNSTPKSRAKVNKPSEALLASPPKKSEDTKSEVTKSSVAETSNSGITEEGEILGTFKHALLRPDTYIGSVRTSKTPMFVFDEETKTAKLKTIKFNPGLFQIIKEIGSNAIDNKWRSEQLSPDNLLKHIDFSIDLSTGSITIHNDGYCIPCVKKTYTFEVPGGATTSINVYPVEAFFGYINSGTNYNDATERKTSGKNGMGGTLVNIFSKNFTVECTNPKDKMKVVATFKNNGTEKDVKDEPFTGKKGYTTVTFTPDYKYFKYPSTKETPGISQDLISVIKLYAYEVAMITQVPVKFTVTNTDAITLVTEALDQLTLSNDSGSSNIVSSEIIKVTSLEKYSRLFYPDISKNKMFYFKSPSGDECVLIETDIENIPDETDSLSHISFVNGLRTKKGGVHVIAWQDALIGSIVRTFNARKPKSKKHDPVKTTARGVYPYLTIFLRCEVDRPKFDDQTKECLNEIVDVNGKNAKYRLFPVGNKKMADAWKEQLEIGLGKIMKWNFVKHLDEKLSLKAEIVTKKDGAIKSRVHCGSKYIGANYAGVSGEAHKCYLWLAEGDSAKTTVLTGISNTESGADYNGVFALKGKLINVAKHAEKRVSENTEVKAIIDILGLRPHVDYRIRENLLKLRYGGIIMATDQDDDGHHIKGLIMNFIATSYPTLISTGFLRSLSTAVVALPAKKSSTEQKLFFSNPDYAKWQEVTPEEEKKRYGRPIYYKGLGSIPPKCTPTYFINPRLVEYTPPGEGEEDMIKLNYMGEKESIAWRKSEIIKGLTSALDPDAPIQRIEPDFVYEGRMTTNQFILDQNMIYNRMTLGRAIPCIWDGFKDAQRKALFGVMHENPMDPQNIEELTCTVKKVSSYHHGAVSLSGTIIKMVQGFVGSNNIPYFTLDGQCGSRTKGGEDAAQPRYPATKLEDIVKAIYITDDAPLLPKNYDGSKEIEPVYYMPVICMLLVNGADGIGVGWSSTVPSFNPEDIMDRTEEYVNLGFDGDDYKSSFPRLVPWYRGFTGTIENTFDKNGNLTGWSSRGIMRECTEPEYKGWWEITEAPIGLWSEDLLLWMEYLETGNAPEGKTWKKRKVQAIHEYRKHVGFNSINVRFRPTKDFSPDIDTAGNFNILKTKGSYSNMWAIDENNYPHKFSTPEEILRAFCKKRAWHYELRYDNMMKVLEEDKKKTYNQYRFVKAIVEKQLDITVPENDELLDELLSSETWNFDRIYNKRESEVGALAGFAYLLNIKIQSITKTKFEELFQEYEKYEQKIEELSQKTPKDLWREDLANLRVTYSKFLKTRDDNIVVGKDGKLAKGKAKSRRPRISSKPVNKK